MSVETLLPLLAFLFPLAYSPGPGNAFFAAIGASKGLKATVPALAGYHVATFVVTAVIGLGMGVTVLKEPAVAASLAAVGSIYVLWLAWTFIRSARARGVASSESDAPEPRIGFWAGVVVLVVNPKAYYIIAVMFAQFLRPADGGDAWTVLAITAVFTLNNLVAFIAWAALGRALTALFRGERSKRRIDYLFAATLVAVAVAVWMVASLFT